MRNLVVVLIMFGLSTSWAHAQKDEQALSILDQMSEKYRKMGGFTSDFTYTLNNPTEEINDDFKGKISISGNKYYLDLGTQKIINNGTTLWTFLPDVQEVNIANYDPDEETLSLNNIFDVYKDGYKYIVNPDFTTNAISVVDLIPEDKDNEFFKIRMFIDQSSYLKKFQIFERSGNRYIYTIDSFEEKSSFPVGTFSFDEKQYPDVEVIDFR